MRRAPPSRGAGGSDAHRPICAVCHRPKRLDELVPAGIIRPQLAARIEASVPGWGPESFICREDLGQFRLRYVEALLQDELGEVDRLERSVVARIAEHETVTTDTDETFGRRRTLGERLADRVASFGGSWSFIILFGLLMAGWMGLNGHLLATGRAAFDPFPYILLNLVLSCLAAIQAPIIMMSQNRQEARDRARAQNDYVINLKAELEIRLLHEKLDHLLRHQWERLTEIQQVQIELMADLGHRAAPPAHGHHHRQPGPE